MQRCTVRPAAMAAIALWLVTAAAAAPRAQDAASPLAASDYLVLAAFPPDDPFDRAAARLAKHHAAPLLRFDPADLGALVTELRARAPRNVAIVVRMDQLDFDLARRLLQLACDVDDDPFADFAHGFVTGAEGDEALRFVERLTAARTSREPPRLAVVAGGVARSAAFEQPFPLRKARLRAKHFHVRGNGEDDRVDAGAEPHDRAFVHEKAWPGLRGASALTFVGHGWPDRVAGGPDHRDLADLELPGAVVLNVACYTGATGRWWDVDWRAGRLRQREVPAGESFALALLRTGVIGYVAYVCPRPAGPELDTDLAALVAGGVSLGEARRRDYDKTVLGFLGYGEPRLALARIADGAPLPRSGDVVRDVMLEGATGGVLFGDPAFVPFAGVPDETPVRVTTERAGDDALVVRLDCGRSTLFTQCSDPTAKFGDTMAMRLYARVPIGDAHVRAVDVEELTLGRRPQEHRVVWAFERDRGEHFLQLKVLFARPRLPADTAARVRVTLTHDATRAVARGGFVAPKPVPPPDPRSRTIDDAMLAAAAARQVSREALQAALDASAATLESADARPEEVTHLAAFGSEGFRALCALLSRGHHHFRTSELLAATWHAGDEAHLLQLLEGDTPLPHHASWSALEGLAVADTDAVRQWLLRRLEGEADAGCFFAAARALARLGERRAVPCIGGRLLEFRSGWAGVEAHLVAALAQLGGDEARGVLERYAAEPRAKHADAARQALRLDGGR